MLKALRRLVFGSRVQRQVNEINGSRPTFGRQVIRVFELEDGRVGIEIAHATLLSYRSSAITLEAGSARALASALEAASRVASSDAA